jgi:hypothetical protein
LSIRRAIAVVLLLSVPVSVVGAELNERGLRATAVAPIFEEPMTVPVGGFCMIEVTDIPLDKLDFVIIGGEYRWDGKQVAYVAKKPMGRVLLDARTHLALILVPTQEEYRGVYHVVQTGGEALRIRPLTIGTGPRPVDPIDPDKPPPVEPPPPTTKATSVVFVYEKDSHEVPKPVLAALNKLNREKKVRATLLEADTVDGTGQVPEQYKAALAAAKEKGLPCLVLTTDEGRKVLSVVPNPKTEDAVLKAVQ